MAGRTGRIASRNGSRDSVGNRAGSGTRPATTPTGGGMIRSGSNSSRPQTAASGAAAG